MDPERYEFLRNENAAYHLSSNAFSRIMARGLDQGLRTTHSRTPLLTLINSEAHILCSDVDITTTKVAFGRWALPKLKRDILSSDPLVSKRALMSLLHLVHDPERAVEAIRLQFVPRLVRLMLSKDPFVRQRVLMIIEVLAMQPSGKQAITSQKTVVNNLLILLSDQDKSVRLSAAQTALSMATWYLSVTEMIRQYFISTIINQLDVELDNDIMVVLLDTLELLLDQDMETKKFALDNRGIELAVLLDHPLVKIRVSACAVLAQLAHHARGKQAILEHRSDILLNLTRLLDDEEVEMRTQAAAVLMFTLIKTEAKVRALKLSTAQLLLHNAQLSHQHSALQANSFKALTSIAEAPSGQEFLKHNLSVLETIQPADILAQQHKEKLLSIVTRVI